MVSFVTNTWRVREQTILNTFYILNTFKYVFRYLVEYTWDVLFDGDVSVASLAVAAKAALGGPTCTRRRRQSTARGTVSRARRSRASSPSG